MWWNGARLRELMERLSGPGRGAALMGDMGRAITDAELVAASRRGEREAFGHLVERYLGLVCAVTYSSTRNQALSEDVAQETFLAAWAQLDQLREVSRVRSWLCGIARNLARKANARSLREEPHDSVDEARATAWAMTPTATPFEAASKAETERLVWAALGNVPAAYREVLVLYYQQQRSVREVADALGISEDATLQRLGRGRKHLQGQVTDLVEEALAGSRPRRGLAAAVVAALPPMGFLGAGSSSLPAMAKASGSGAAGAASSSLPVVTHTAGARMLKIAFVLFAGAGVAGATYVATNDKDARPPAPVAASAPAPLASSAEVPDRPLPSASGLVPAPRPPGARIEVPREIPAVECDPEPDDEDGACERRVHAVDDDDEQLTDELVAEVGLYRGPAKGPADAVVEIAVFQDLECPFCAKVLGTIDQLWDEYPGQLRLVVKQMPLPNHKHAQLAAEATLAAEAQGRFWEYHDLALAYQDDLTRASLVELAGKAGLDVGAFTRALDQHTYAPQVASDVAAASSLAITGTPTFFINGKRFTGAQPIEQFRKAIDVAIAARRAAK